MDLDRRLQGVMNTLKREKEEEEQVLVVTEAPIVHLGPVAGEDLITLRVKCQHQDDFFYRMRRNLPLGFLMKDYCHRTGFPKVSDLRFLFHGRIRGTRTPQEIGMEDGSNGGNIKRKLREVEEDSFILVEGPLGATQANLVWLGRLTGEDLITLKVQRQNEEDIYYRMENEVRLGYLMLDYCHCKGLTLESVRFIFYGKNVKQNHTPKEIEMEDGGILDTFSEQMGG